VLLLQQILNICYDIIDLNVVLIKDYHSEKNSIEYGPESVARFKSYQHSSISENFGMTQSATLSPLVI
jgi:hypothetical protein